MNKPATPKKPHVVWIMCDQLRSDKLGFMGDSIARTPNLDRLANRGVVFEKMYPQCSVCMGSRASILTGRYLRTCGMSGGSPLLDPREITWPTVLQEAGYQTGLFGKLHVTPQQYTLKELDRFDAITDATVFLEPAGIGRAQFPPSHHNYGFQHQVPYEDILPSGYKDWVAKRDPKLAAILPQKGMQSWEGWNQRYTEHQPGDIGPTVTPVELHPSMYIANSASEYFQSHHKQGPCAMQVSFVDPHHPFDPPAELLANYPLDQMPLPRHTDTGDVQWPQRLLDNTTDYKLTPEEQTRDGIACYYAMIEMADLAVGELVKTIEEAGELDNTIFLFVADHGEYLGDYGLWRKGSYHYDCVMHVPAFISYPHAVPAGQRSEGLTEALDMTATLFGLLDIDLPAGIQGTDMTQGLKNKEHLDRPWIYTELHTTPWGPFLCIQTLRTHTAQLDVYPEDEQSLLFDLEADPDQRRDVYNDPAYQSLRDQMQRNMFKELSRQTDPLPKPLSQF
ncbi:MAG: sulfatase-like hydrolase/transferase [Phycisphaeraceae bacterium]|nr:sulfatase-like hydrolase/transferase [Phycisphaeraceae bacterium]